VNVQEAAERTTGNIEHVIVGKHAEVRSEEMSYADAIKAAGITEFVHIKTNAAQALQAWQEKLA